jgi:hypothetical protein
MPPKPSDFEREMQQLEAEIKRLEAEYNMFFGNRLPRLPWETRARVDALMKRYDRMPLGNTAQRFRFDTLQSRYAKFCQLWERSLKAKEEGRPERGRRVDATPTAGARRAEDSEEAAAAAQARSRVLHVATFRDPDGELERLMELYQRLAEARQQTGEQPVPYHRLVDVVRAQVNKLGSGGSEVAFRVAVKDGKVTLTAKAIKG